MRLATAAIGLLLAFASAAVAQESCPTAEVRINDSAPIPPASRRWLEQELREAARKVCTWWGASFTGAFTVEVLDSGGPSMALIPAWQGQRGHMIFRAPAVRRSQAATVHEITHVFAPNANRFLAEGLAIYAHEMLAGPTAYPNFGASLHTSARPYAQADIAALDRLATPSLLELDRLGGRESYLVAGSFVRFLVEQHGMEKFRRLYALTPLVPRERNAGAPGRWREVYGLDLDQLTQSWRNSLNPPQRI
jgi:UrcA family protein